MASFTTLTKDAIEWLLSKTKTGLASKENLANKIATISSSLTDAQYPSAKAVKQYITEACYTKSKPDVYLDVETGTLYQKPLDASLLLEKNELYYLNPNGYAKDIALNVVIDDTYGVLGNAGESTNVQAIIDLLVQKTVQVDFSDSNSNGSSSGSSGDSSSSSSGSSSSGSSSSGDSSTDSGSSSGSTDKGDVSIDDDEVPQ